MKVFDRLVQSHDPQALAEGLKMAKDLANNKGPASGYTAKDIGEGAELAWIRLYKQDRKAALELAEDLFAKPGRFTQIFSQRVHESYQRMARQDVDITRHPMMDAVLLARLATTIDDAAVSGQRDTTVRIMSKRYIKEMAHDPATTAVKAISQANDYKGRDIATLLTVIANQAVTALEWTPDKSLDANALAKAGQQLNAIKPKQQGAGSVWRGTFGSVWRSIAEGIRRAPNGGDRKQTVFAFSLYRQSADNPLVEKLAAGAVEAQAAKPAASNFIKDIYSMFRKLAAAGGPATGVSPSAAKPAVQVWERHAGPGLKLPVGEVTELDLNLNPISQPSPIDRLAQPRQPSDVEKYAKNHPASMPG